MRMFIPICLVALSGCVAVEASGDRPAISSDSPEAMFEHAEASEVATQMVSSCLEMGMAVTVASASRVVCESEVGMTHAISAQAGDDSGISTSPRLFLEIELAEERGDVRAQVASWIEMETSSGEISRGRIDQTAEQKADFQNFLLAAGEGFERRDRVSARRNHGVSPNDLAREARPDYETVK